MTEKSSESNGVTGESTGDQEPTASPPPPPPPPPPPTAGAPQTVPAPRLVRRDEGKFIAGVCTGLAGYTGIDVVAWRIGFVVLGLTTGIGLLAYIVMWIVMPMARPGEPVAAPNQGGNDTARWVGIAAIVGGILLALRGTFSIFDDFHPFRGGVFWGIVLIAVGFAIWGRDRSRPPTETRPVPPIPPSPPAARPSSTAYAAAEGPAAFASTEPTLPGVPPVDDPPASRTDTTPIPSPGMADHSTRRDSESRRVELTWRREPSFLGRLVIGAGALAIGTLLLISNIGVFDVSARLVIAVLLGIVGAGLIVGTWAGRARWLIFPGIGLSLALLTTALIPFNLSGGWGEIAWSPQTVREIAPSYEQSAGQAALDLSEVDFGRRDVDVDVRLGFGELYIVLPEDPDVVVNARVQGGEMNLFGRVSEGWDVRQTVVSDGDARRAPTVTIDVRVTFGEINVLRGTSDDIPGSRSNRFDRRFDRRLDLRDNTGG